MRSVNAPTAPQSARAAEIFDEFFRSVKQEQCRQIPKQEAGNAGARWPWDSSESLHDMMRTAAIDRQFFATV